LGRGTRRIVSALYRARGKNTEDLILTNVAVIEGFYLNIVLEALLKAKGL
jgi:hypothetical protein